MPEVVAETRGEERNFFKERVERKGRWEVV